jgi:hypothetical protein
MHYNTTKSGVDVLDKIVKEYVCTRSTRCWPLKLFLNLTDVASVNAFVLWMLKYPNWPQKKKPKMPVFASYGRINGKHHI